MLLVVYTVGARSSTVLLPPTLQLGQTLPLFITVGARTSAVLPPPTLQ